MSLVLLSGPAAEPVTLAEAKAHLRVDTAADDALISSLIVTSRLHIEAALGLALIAQSWSLRLNEWPLHGAVVLPLRPVTAVTAVKVTDAAGAPITLAASLYLLDRASIPSRLLPTDSWVAPGVAANGIAIDFTAGYGAVAADVPQPIRQALLLLVAHWYENREPVRAGDHAAPVPLTVNDLLAPYRLVRL